MFKSCLLSVCLIFAIAVLSNANEYPPSRAATAVINFNNLGHLVYGPVYRDYQRFYGHYIVPGVGRVEIFANADSRAIMTLSSDLTLDSYIIKDKLRALRYMQEHFCPGLSFMEDNTK